LPFAVREIAVARKAGNSCPLSLSRGRFPNLDLTLPFAIVPERPPPFVAARDHEGRDHDGLRSPPTFVPAGVNLRRVKVHRSKCN
jgi:hypothetical protein